MRPYLACRPTSEVLRSRAPAVSHEATDCCKLALVVYVGARLVVYVEFLSSPHVCTRAMVKSKGTKRGRKKKRVAAHIKDAAEKRAASAFSGNSGEDQRTQLLASPLGVGRPKRPRGPGQLLSVSCTAVGHRATYLLANGLCCRIVCGPPFTYTWYSEYLVQRT